MSPNLLEEDKAYLLITMNNKIIKVYCGTPYSSTVFYYNFIADSPAKFFSRVINLEERHVKTRLYELSRLWKALYEN